MDAVWNSFHFSPSYITGSVPLKSAPEHICGNRADAIYQLTIFFDTKEHLIVTLKCELHLKLTSVRVKTSLEREH